MTKSNRRATVHRPALMDSIFIKEYDDSGLVVGEHLFVGLFTSVAYNTSARDIPYLRNKVVRVLARARFDPRSHDGKALVHILENFPRDELFQISDDELFEIAIGMLHLQERQRTALFVRRDPFERFITGLVYMPARPLRHRSAPAHPGDPGEGVRRQPARPSIPNWPKARWRGFSSSSKRSRAPSRTMTSARSRSG